MHYVLAKLTVKADAVGAFAKLMTELAQRSREESGCEAYDVYQQQPSPQVFQTVERWKTAADADAHMETSHVAAALAAAGPLLAAPPEILVHTKLV